MPFYRRLGEVPAKRHTVFRKPDGSLYQEELIGNKGFSGISSLLYHLHPPTEVLRYRPLEAEAPEPDAEPALHHRHFATSKLSESDSPVLGRTLLMYNADVRLSFVQARAEDDFYYRNGTADELLYVSDGEGVLESVMGELPLRAGDYVVIPRGIVHRYRFTGYPVRLLVLETVGDLRTPGRYRNEHGQLKEGAPFSERDLRAPQELVTHDEAGEYRILARHGTRLTEYVVAHHPFDVVGWDGYYFPWALSIHDFEPIVGRIHQPPPVHQTFESSGVVVCSFVPRPFDFDPAAIPAPYNHTNAMSDEVIYYASSEFMSRKGIAYGSITLHPDGLPHGPHPGRYEASVGQTRTDELAVMIDTFRPLTVTRAGRLLEDESYPRSWIE
jgi:homogentisate 1,2-dioxygenase